MKTVIEMAREAGIDWHRCWNDDESNRLEQFAELVRADERDRAMRENAYVLAEREACAKVCDVLSDKHSFEGCYANECAAAIRARENT